MLLSSLVTTGCWDRAEINDLALVMGAGIDLTEEGDFLGTVQIAIPAAAGGAAGSGGMGGGSAGGGQQSSFFIETVVGKSISDMNEKLQVKLSRKMYIAHRRVLVIGERLAKRGIGDLLDWFGRDPSSRLRTFIVVAKGGEAIELLRFRHAFERFPIEALRELERRGIGTEVTMRDLLMTASGEGIQPVMAAVERAGQVSEKGDQKAEKGQKGGPVSEPGSTYRLAGTALFKDLELAGYLDNSETQGLLWIRGKLHPGIIYADVPEGLGHVGFELLRAERRIQPEFYGNRVKFNIELKGEGVIHENNTRLDLNQPENVRLVKEALKKSIEKRIRQTVTKIQREYGTDVLGLGRELQRRYPKQWAAFKDNWEQQFPETEVSLKLDLTILRSGMTGSPLHLEEREIKKKSPNVRQAGIIR